MSSRKEKYENFRPYFKEEDKKEGSVPLKEITFMPSTIETIDFALYEWLNEDLQIFCTTNEGWKRVPLIWSMPERSFQIKDNKDLRNKDVFVLPAVSIERTSMEKDPNMKGVAWSHVPRQNDAKGGAITVARRIIQKRHPHLLMPTPQEFLNKRLILLKTRKLFMKQYQCQSQHM